MDNLRIWDKVSRTDPAYTKKAKVGGQNITSISGTSVVLEATKLFGPVGIGWGYEIVEERFDAAGPILSRDEEKRVLGEQIMHTIRVRVWYMEGDKRGSVEHYGHTPFVYSSQHGATTDMEAPKKSLTDALKKALSMLGFNADIFLGDYDDPEYVRAQQTRSQIERSENRAEALTKAQEEFEAWLQDKVKTIGQTPHAAAVRRVRQNTIEQAPNRAAAAEYPEDKYHALISRFDAVVTERLEALKQEKGNG